ncbi:unnamed protein product [Rhizophagus irregularis]|nr:unnamed protein product [Rhizophagus irregularis]
MEGNNLELPNELTTLLFHQKEIESLDYSEDKDDSDKSSSVDPVDQSQLDQFKDEYYGVQDLGQDGDELEEDDYNETTLQPKRIANLAY